MKLRKLLFSFALFFVAATSFAQFGTETLLTQFSSVSHFTVGDLDNDGKKDLVTTETKWYRQLDGVQFGEPSFIGTACTKVALADLDGNGWLDVVTSNTDSSVWYPNLGGGNFGGGISFYNTSFEQISFGDYDGDGDLDISAVSINNLIWFKNVNGTFALQQTIAGNMYSLLTTDLDNDGDLDILSGSSDDVFFIENTDGTGNAFNQIPLLSANTTYYTRLALDDMDLDGDDDLVAMTGYGVYWYERTGVMQFVYPGKQLSNVGTGDFFLSFINEDPLPDVLYFNNSKIIWAPHQLYPQAGLSDKDLLDVEYTTQILVTDLDSDGHDDLLYLEPNNLYWLSDLRSEATGDQAFAFNAPLGQFGSLKFDMGDVDGDGYIDLASSEGPLTAWYRQLPGKNLFSERKEIGNRAAINGLSYLKLLDWDGDGDNDLLAGEYTEMILYENEDGAGTFSFRTLLEDSIFTDNLLVKDFDGDGDFDFVGFGSVEPGLLVWKNVGQNHFQKQLIANFIGATKLECADAGKDGDLDLFLSVFGSSFNYELFFIENDNDIFLPPDTVTTSNYLFDFDFVADFNNNGNVSLLTYDLQVPGFTSLYEFRYSPATHAMEDAGVFATFPDGIAVQPFLLAAEDMDGDSDLDLIYDRLDQKIRWLENDNGAFSNEVILIDGSPTTPRLLWHDVDLDGDKDICHLLGNQVSWFENAGGNFQAANRRIIAANLELKHLNYGDMDADGDLDLVGFNVDHFVWMENYDGLGHFASEQKIANFQPLGNPNETIHLYDADNDNDLDLLFHQYSPYLFRNNGNGVFTQSLVNAANNEGLVLAKLNADVYPDIVGYNYFDKVVQKYVYLPASSNYAASSIIATFNNYVLEVVAIDLDRDGALDLVVAVENNSSSELSDLYYLLNNGAGNFSAPVLLLNNAWRNAKLAVGDINQDGFDDLVAGMVNVVNQLMWFPNVNGPGFLGEGVMVGTHNNFWGKTIVADMDADGDPDLVNNNHWHENMGSGLFGTVHEVASPTLFTVLSQTLSGVADIDADGTPDLLTQNEWIQVPPANLGGGNFDRLKRVAGIGNAPQQKTPILPFDADLDGDLDLLSGQGAAIMWFENKPVGGDANFSPPVKLLDSPNGAITRLLSRDVDDDGRFDLVFSATSSFGWFKMQANASFSAPILANNTIGLDQYGPSTVDDFDGDGDIDFLLPWIAIMELEGNNQFSWHDVAGLNGITNLQSGDGDNDGDADIFYQNNIEPAKVWWLRNDGNFQFAPPAHFCTPDPGQAYQALHILDLDNDGKTDVVTAYSFEVKIVFMKNLDNGSNFQPNTIHTGTGFSQNFEFMHFSDPNNDQLTDIAYYYNSETQLHWLYQREPGVFIDSILPMDDPIDFTNLKNMASADIDSDGDLDLLYATWGTIYDEKKMFWRENLLDAPVISGQCFLDENENAQFDAGEVPLLDCHTQLDPKALLGFPDSNGVFKYYVELGDWELSYVSNNPVWELTTGSPSYLISIDTLPYAIHKLFGLKPILDTLALEPFLVSATTRCSFSVPFWLTAKNTGTRTIDGQIKLVVPPMVIFESASTPPDLVSGDTLIWDFTDLHPSYGYDIDLTLKMPDANNVGDQLVFNTLVSVPDAQTGDTLVFQDEYVSILSCAVDPNDKLVTPNRLGDYDQNYTLFGERLEYTIRFQNTGNDTAFNITLTDQLDANLDWTTFQPITASHYYEASLDSSGLLTVLFRNILLPDTAVNEVGSHGFFSYTIRSKPGLPENTAISNTADIYFDYNDAIVTNTTNNVLVTMLPTADKDRREKLGFKVYPNPVGTGRSLTVETPWDNAEVRLTDVYGRTMAKKQAVGRLGVLPLPNGPTGLHLLSISNGGQRVVFKVVILD